MSSYESKKVDEGVPILQQAIPVEIYISTVFHGISKSPTAEDVHLKIILYSLLLTFDILDYFRLWVEISGELKLHLADV